MSSAPSPCPRRTGPRLRACRAAPACGACSPASAAPASSTGRYCPSFALFPGSGVDDLAVEQVDEILHEAVGLDRALRLGVARVALAGLDRGGAGARGLAEGNLQRHGGAEVALERGLELVLVVALGEVGLRLRYDQVEAAVVAALQLGVPRQLAGRARKRELLDELRPVGGRRRGRPRLRRLVPRGCRLAPRNRGRR